MQEDATPDDAPRSGSRRDAPGPQSERDSGRDSLHPSDAAWIASRSAAAPLILGTIAIVTSPILLGLPFGALGIRSGVDLWQRGARRGTVVLAIAVAAAGVVLSIVAAVAWGALLAGVLLGRDAIREAEGWRGRTVARTVAPIAGDGAAPGSVALDRPPDGAERLAILFVSVGAEPSRDAIRALADATAAHPAVKVVVIDPGSSVSEVESFVRLHAPASTAFATAGAVRSLPDPLDRIVAFPTLVVIDRDGRIEKALVGAHPSSDLEKLLRGEAALPPDSAGKPRGRR